MATNEYKATKSVLITITIMIGCWAATETFFFANVAGECRSASDSLLRTIGAFLCLDAVLWLVSLFPAYSVFLITESPQNASQNTIATSWRTCQIISAYTSI